MSTTDAPTLVDVIAAAVASRVGALHTSAPGVVESYDAAEQKATIRLAIMGRRFDGATDSIVAFDLPLLPNVPVSFPSTPLGSLTFPVMPGDPVVVVFAERSIDEWKTAGEPGVEPRDHRRFSLSDAVAFPCSSSFATAIPPEGLADGATVLRGDDVRLGDATAVDFVALASLVEANFAALKVWLDVHVHADVTPPTTPSPAASAVAATKVKAI